MSNCESAADPQRKSECWSQVATERTIVTVTVASLLGAAAGYAGARALRSDPKTGVLIGLVVGGGAAAAVQYGNYLLEKAGNDRLLALELAVEAQRKDIAAFRQSTAETNAQVRQDMAKVTDIQKTQYSQQISLREQAATLREIKEKVEKLEKEARINITAGDIYVPAANHIGGPQRDDPRILVKIETVVKDQREYKAAAISAEEEMRISRDKLMKQGLL